MQSAPGMKSAIPCYSSIQSVIDFCIFFLKYNSEMKDSKSRKLKVQLVHVDTTQLDLDHDFELSSITPSDDGTSGETIFELKSVEPPSQDMEVIYVKKECKYKVKVYF